MIRHILALIGLVITLGTFWYMYKIDVEVDALGKIDKIYKKSQMMVELGKKSSSHAQLQSGGSAPITPIDSSSDSTTNIEKKNKEADDKLKALKEKAGNVGGFKVSKLYKGKCASCHGYNGEGGVGPKLIGKNYDELSSKLADFKSGKKKNYVMYGLLQNLNDEDLDSLAKEISEFAKRAEELNK